VAQEVLKLEVAVQVDEATTGLVVVVVEATQSPHVQVAAVPVTVLTEGLPQAPVTVVV
jgi:hypothetical protein